MKIESRINRRQQRRAVLTSILLIAGTAGIIALFFSFLMPLLMNQGGEKKTSLSVTEADTLPPSPPFLNSTYEATNSADLSISGFSEPKSLVLLRKNGASIDQTNADDSGAFKFHKVTLSSGANKFEFTAKDEAGNESTATTVMVRYITEAPELTITSPANNSTISKRRDQVVSIQGKTDPAARVLVNDKIAIVNSDGTFSSLFQLQEGSNTISIRAVSIAGTETKQELTVLFQP